MPKMPEPQTAENAGGGQPAGPPSTSPPEPKDPATGPTTEGGEVDENDDPADLGDAGTKALRAERTKARAEAKRRRELEAELASLRATAAAKDAKPDAPLDAKAIAEAAKAEARAELLKDRVVDKIEVLASKSFANPDLARRLLASDVDSFVSGGRVDTEAIQDALADLLEANPGLGITPQRRFQGSVDQGPRGSKGPDLDTQIAAAMASGNVREQIRLQNLKILPAIQKMVTGSSS